MGKNKRSKLILKVFISGLILTLLITLFFNFQLSFKSNHCQDNLYLINEDLQILSKILESKELEYKDFKSVPDSLKSKFHLNEEQKTVSFQLITVSFNQDGKIINIQH